MKSILLALTTCMIFLVESHPASAQIAYQVRLLQQIRVANSFDVDVEIKRTGATTFVLGTSSFTFNYNKLGMRAPARVNALIGPWSSVSGSPYVGDLDYQFLDFVADTTVGFAGLTVLYVGGIDDDNGPLVPDTGFVRVGTVRFAIINAADSSRLTWRNVGTTTQVFQLTSPGTPSGGETQITSFGTFINPSNTPLPIQLGSFTALVLNQNRVRLDWITLSELNNYGFFVQRRRAEDQQYTDLPNSFIPGHGTTTEPQHYSYADSAVGSGNWWYRLKQVDLDGAIHFTEGVQAEVLTSVKEEAPRVFALLQNYPNPFNPTTEIKFSVENTAHATLNIYNVLGQHVATLFDDIAEAGQYYRVRLNASGLATGLYFYKLESNRKSNLKKMLLVK